MSFDDVSAKNMEVYTPSFERGNDQLKSRENLSNSEKVKTNNAVLSVQEEFDKISESLKTVENLSKVANLKVSQAASIANSFNKIPKLTLEELKEFEGVLPGIYKSFIGAEMAAIKLLTESINEISRNNEEELKANSPVEVAEIKKNMEERGMNRSLKNMISQSLMAVNKLYKTLGEVYYHIT